MKILFFGNSHVTALSHAWPEMRTRYPQVDAVFLPLARMRADCFTVRGNRLVSHSEQVARVTQMRTGARDIDPADYDAIALVGLNYLLELAILGMGVGPQLYHHLIYAHFMSTMMGSTLRRIRQISDVPLAVVPTPFLARPALPSARKLSAEPFYAQISRVLDNQGTKFIPQPSETVTADVFTLEAFGVDAPRDAYQEGAAVHFHPEGDTNHMNARYGALVMRDLLAALEAPGAGV